MQLYHFSTAHNSRLDDMAKSIDDSTGSLRDEVKEVHTQLIPDLCSEVDAMSTTALARLPPHPGVSTTVPPTTAPDAMPKTTDSTIPDDSVPADHDANDSVPTDRNATTDAAPSESGARHSVRFGATRDPHLHHGQDSRYSFGDSCFGPPRSFTSPTLRSDDSWYRSGNHVPHVTPDNYKHPTNNGSTHYHSQNHRPCPLSTLNNSTSDPTLGGLFGESSCLGLVTGSSLHTTSISVFLIFPASLHSYAMVVQMVLGS